MKVGCRLAVVRHVGSSRLVLFNAVERHLFNGSPWMPSIVPGTELAQALKVTPTRLRSGNRYSGSWFTPLGKV
jgi:hypothetical protein